MKTAITDPWKIVTTAFDRPRARLPRAARAPARRAGRCSRRSCCSPPCRSSAINLLSAAATQTSIRFHYTAGLIPVLIVAAVFGAARIVRRRPDLAPSLATARGGSRPRLELHPRRDPALALLPRRRAAAGLRRAGDRARPDRGSRAEADPGRGRRQRDQLARRAPLGAAAGAQLPVHPGRTLGRGRRDGARLRRPARALADRRPALLAAAQPRVAARLRARRDPDLPAGSARRRAPA